MAAERLQKLLARAGVSSRRAAEQLVLDGRVRVNGQVVRELGAKADTSRDRIEVDGRVIARESHAYYLLNKPKNLVTTLSDPEGRPSLKEVLQRVPERVYPVGRLDFHTSGVLLLTNDGDLAQALLHPSREVPKTYVAKLNAIAGDRDVEMLKRGVTLDDGYQTAPARVTRLRDEDEHSWLEITITEGKNRQVHRMIEAVGLRVMRLSRTRFAGLDSAGLRPGQLRPLDTDEIAALKRVYQGIAEPVRVPKPRAERERVERGTRGAKSEERGARSEERGARSGERGARGGERGTVSAQRGAKGGAKAGAKGGDRERSQAERSSRQQGTRTKAETAGKHGEKPRSGFDKTRGARHKSRPT
jgi:23S rRNA pseudouridine2605 synthase